MTHDIFNPTGRPMNRAERSLRKSLSFAENYGLDTQSMSIALRRSGKTLATYAAIDAALTLMYRWISGDHAWRSHGR